MGDTIIALYKKVFPHIAANQIPSVHQIAEDMGCMGPEGSALRSICKIHESISEGIMRLRELGECPRCFKDWRDGEDDTMGQRKSTGGSPQRKTDSNRRKGKVTPQSNVTRHPPQTPHRSPLVSFKQEEYPHEFPHAASSAMNQHFSPLASQSGRFQNQQRPAVLNGGTRRHNSIPHGLAINDLPTPSYSPIQEGALNDSLYAFNLNPNPYLPQQCQSASMGTSFRSMFFFSRPL